ncbi:MAG: hypothetical protein PHU43_02825 [Candidatus Bipolaricaulis sp.]|nr:hypothetical protein [Candidatus Bipolaricaulis sp.]
MAGDVPPTFSQAESCWDADTVTLSGTLTIRSSRRITVEGRTVTGLGPQICIEGSAGRASMDITIRYCNLIYNSGPRLDVQGSYHRVAIVCTDSLRNLFLQPPFAQVGGQDSCSLYANGASARHREGGPIVAVAVIDSGIDRTIPRLLCHA